MVRKLLTDKPVTAVAILKHAWDQEYKNPHKQKLMNKCWKRNVNLAEVMLHIGKHKGCRDDIKLLQCVNKLKQKYNLADSTRRKISTSTYYRYKPKAVKL